MQCRSLRLTGLIIGLCLLVLANPVLAQTTGAANLTTIVTTYKTQFSSIQSALQNDALSLFWLLAGIEFAYSMIRLALTGADFGDWVGNLVNQILFIGFFYAILTNSVTWGGYIVDSFRQAGNTASQSAGGNTGMSPTDIFVAGVNIATIILSKLDLWKPSQSIGFALAGIIILVCFALIAAMMILTLVVAYGIVSMGVLFMGFGGSRWTKDVAIKIVMAVMGVGAKLFVMEIIVGIGEKMVEGWQNNPEVTIGDACVMVGCSVVMLALVKTIPDLVQSMVNGSAFTSSGALATAAGSVTGAAAGIAATAVGAGFAAAGAGRLASAQLAQSTSAGTAPTSRAGRMASLTTNTAKNFGSAAAQDVGARLGGRAHHGVMTGRMADTLHSQARDLESNLGKPTPPQPPPANDEAQDTANTIRPA